MLATPSEPLEPNWFDSPSIPVDEGTSFTNSIKLKLPCWAMVSLSKMETGLPVSIGVPFIKDPTTTTSSSSCEKIVEENNRKVEIIKYFNNTNLFIFPPRK